jgi:hypothetical protein
MSAVEGTPVRGRWNPDTEHAPVLTCHDYPQASPQEWDCGCVTATHITDRDALAGERPFEMRWTLRCERSRCAIRRMMLDALLVREDLLSSRDWPWTTDTLLAAFQRLDAEA